MADQFRIRLCFVGLGESGAEYVDDGVECRASNGEMVPDASPEPTRVVVDRENSLNPAEFSEFDVIVAAGSVATDGVVDNALRVADACASEAVTMASVTGELPLSDLNRLERAFGTVAPISQEQRCKELATDVFTAFSQPMMLATDYASLHSNLQDGGVVTLTRSVGTRDTLQSLVKQCCGPGGVVFGYVEAGAEFTLADATTLEEQFETPDVITGQASLGDPSGCRLTVLREGR